MNLASTCQQHDLERVRRDRETEAMPTLLMVCGLEKSGATYVRQLLWITSRSRP